MKFSNLMIIFLFSTIVYGQNDGADKYYRHLRYNHVSPYIALTGIYPMDRNTAESTSHYIFSYDASNKLTGIINNHYHTEKKHSLASIGVYKMIITYADAKEIRTFYDKNDKRISNDRDVYKEVFHLDKKGKYTKLEFFDLNDEPMESNWGIASYHWSAKKKLIIEKRYNLKNEPQNISSYFEFGIIGIDLRKDGSPKGCYNLNDALEVKNNSIGVASYQDIYDDHGNHVKYTYHDEDNNLVMNQYGFATGVKIYDANGNYIGDERYDTENKLLFDRARATNTDILISPEASEADLSEIKRISLGYLKALQELKPELMEEVMNDSLNKVTIGYNRKERKEVASAITREKMIENAENWNKSNTKFPTPPSNEIEILDVYNRIASVKLVSDNWVEYLHLIKLDGKWSIINLIWQHKDLNRYPK